MLVHTIITGRNEYFRRVTEEWLCLNDVNHEQIFMDPNKTKKTNECLAKYKAETINRLGVKIYHEDDERIFEYLKRACPNTKIIFIEMNTNVKK